MDLTMRGLAHVLRQERLRSQLSMRALSRISGTPLNDLIDIEWQLTDDVDCFTALRLARSLNLNISELFEKVEMAE